MVVSVSIHRLFLEQLTVSSLFILYQACCPFYHKFYLPSSSDASVFTLLVFLEFLFHTSANFILKLFIYSLPSYYQSWTLSYILDRNGLSSLWSIAWDIRHGKNVCMEEVWLQSCLGNIPCMYYRDVSWFPIRQFSWGFSWCLSIFWPDCTI